jgi:hypothetical protein
MQVHAQVFPWEAPGEAFENIEVLLGELVECDYVLHYEADGKRYVEIVNFTKHQRISGKEAQYKSRLPAPPLNFQKPNDLPSENGEAMGKHPGTSPGSSGEPLGTGEQRNLGTGEPEEQGKYKAPAAEVEKPETVSQQSWDDWKATRKAKRAGPITSTALNMLAKEAAKAGFGMQEAIEMAAGSGWITFKSQYVNGPGTQGKPTTFAQQRLENSQKAIDEFTEMLGG